MASIMQTKRKSYLQNTNARMSKAKYNTDYFLNEATSFDVLWWLNCSIKFLPKQIPAQNYSLTFSITLGSLFSCILIGGS